MKGKASKRNGEKSDGRVVPKKPPNNAAGAPAEAEEVEGRHPTKANLGEQTMGRAQHRETMQNALARIRQVAKQDRKARFTTLWHHVYALSSLTTAFYQLQRNASAGVDGVTWQEYERDLQTHLEDLSARLKRGAYRAKPVARRHIPKSDGTTRPIGIPALEDKIVQRATTLVLESIYEEDFLDISFGFRPGRGQHDALDTLAVGIEKRKVNWVLDADIRGFFDSIDHGWMAKFIEHRIKDQRVVRHIQKWLNAGVLEDGKRTRLERGTPQGGSISPLLANVYLHYVLDLWVQQWKARHANGDLVYVRYADDFVVCFQHQGDAVRFRRALELRLAEFALELHPDKTRLLKFGRFAASDQDKRGGGKPPTFEFLGFTHICGKTRAGRFKLQRITGGKRIGRTAKRIAQILKRKRHAPIPVTGKWLQQVTQGFDNYFGVPGNYGALQKLRWLLGMAWIKALRSRSQRQTMTWDRFRRIASTWLIPPRIRHPYPDKRLRVEPW